MALLRFGQLAQILENLTGRFRRLVARFLFLRVADHTAQLLTVGVRIECNHVADRLIALFNQTIAQHFQFMEQRNLLVVAVLELVQRNADRLDINTAQQFTDQLQLTAATLFPDALCQLDLGAQALIQRDFIQRVFTQINQFGK